MPISQGRGEGEVNTQSQVCVWHMVNVSYYEVYSPYEWCFCKFSKILITLQNSFFVFPSGLCPYFLFALVMVPVKQFENFTIEGLTTKVFLFVSYFLFFFSPYNQVTSGYKAKTIVTALPASFLDPLLSPSLMEDYELRQLVLEVMHNLMDRHDNRAKLRGIR